MSRMQTMTYGNQDCVVTSVADEADGRPRKGGRSTSCYETCNEAVGNGPNLKYLSNITREHDEANDCTHVSWLPPGPLPRVPFGGAFHAGHSLASPLAHVILILVSRTKRAVRSHSVTPLLRIAQARQDLYACCLRREAAHHSSLLNAKLASSYSRAPRAASLKMSSKS